MRGYVSFGEGKLNLVGQNHVYNYEGPPANKAFLPVICCEDGCYPSGGYLEDLYQKQTFRLHPGRLTWNIIIEVGKIIFLSKWVI